MKKSIVLAASTLVLGTVLSGCGSNNNALPEVTTDTDDFDTVEYDELNPTPDSPPPYSEDNACTEWEWDEEQGVWICDDSDSPNYRGYYFNNMFFATATLLMANSFYRNYSSSAAYRGRVKDDRNSGSSSGSSTSSSSSKKPSSSISTGQKGSGSSSGSKGFGSSSGSSGS
ncbi:MAG: hypothetical protein ACRC5C_12720 [Bacilli bacterium]